MVVDGTGASVTVESRKAEDVSDARAVRTRWAFTGFEDLKPRGLTSGISGERSESAAWCARHGRGTGGGSPLGALTEGTQHRRGRGALQREEKASDGSLR